MDFLLLRIQEEFFLFLSVPGIFGLRILDLLFSIGLEEEDILHAVFFDFAD